MFHPGLRRAQCCQLNFPWPAACPWAGLEEGSLSGYRLWETRKQGWAGVAVAVLAACAELDHVFHSPLSVSPAGEELRFPVLQTKKWMEVFTQCRVQPFWSLAAIKLLCLSLLCQHVNESPWCQISERQHLACSIHSGTVCFYVAQVVMQNSLCWSVFSLSG